MSLSETFDRPIGYGERKYGCPAGHEWWAVGEYTWNPWGPPDWRPRTRSALDCPTCRVPGHQLEPRQER